MKIIITAVMILSLLAGNVHAEGAGSREIQDLTQTTSFNDNTLQAEAAEMGIPASQTKRYVVDMKSLNHQYQQGSLTRTEYVAAKQNLIESLK